MNGATWGTLAVELAIGLLVWNRNLRPWVLAAGVVMHTMIMATIAVGFFSLAMFAMYLAFVPSQTVQRLPDTINRLIAKLRHDDRLSAECETSANETGPEESRSSFTVGADDASSPAAFRWRAAMNRAIRVGVFVDGQKRVVRHS